MFISMKMNQMKKNHLKNQALKERQQAISQAHVHDLSFKRFFDNVENISAFLNLAFSQAFLNLFNLDSLKIEKNVLIAGIEMQIDLLISLTLKNSQKTVKFIFLLEHKSWPDHNVLKQLLKYQATVYEKYGYPVIPIVFYHGMKKWTVPISFHDHLESQGYFPDHSRSLIAPYLMNFSYVPFDLSVYDIESKAKGSIISPILHLFQGIWSLDSRKSTKEQHDFFIKFFSFVKKVSKSTDKKYIIELITKAMTYFYQYNNQLNKEVVQSASKEVTQQLGGEDLMEAFDFTIEGTMKKGIQIGQEKGIQIGREKGRQEGRQEGEQSIILKMLKNNMDISTIAKITESTENKIREIQKKLNNLS